MKLIQPRPFNARKTLVVGSVLLAFILYTYFRPAPGPRHPHWSGQTMGTTYSVTLANSSFSLRGFNALKKAVDDYLVEVNRQMSTYLPDSEISRFNRTRSTEPFPVSASFAEVTRFALDLSRRSGGAFDPTLEPLVSLWGFGAAGRDRPPPEEAQIQKTLSQAGYRRLAVPSPGHLQKSIPELQVDLNAVAKGYAADGVARLITAAGSSNVFVEIGGDCVARGHNPDGQPWRIGIDRPVDSSLPGESLQRIVHLAGRAVATSGDYRNYRFDAEGQRVAHILDPRTGRPVQHHVASVSVVAEDGLTADGLATTLFVMGEEEGLAWAEKYPGAEALFLLREPDGTFRERKSSGFDVYITPESARRKITFDLTVLDPDGLRGPDDGKRSLSYEFCIPDTADAKTEVRTIDPSVQFMPGSTGRMGCGSSECLCIGSTDQPDFGAVLLRLARLDYIRRIDECFFE